MYSAMICGIVNRSIWIQLWYRLKLYLTWWMVIAIIVATTTVIYNYIYNGRFTSLIAVPYRRNMYLYSEMSQKQLWQKLQLHSTWRMSGIHTVENAFADVINIYNYSMQSYSTLESSTPTNVILSCILQWHLHLTLHWCKCNTNCADTGLEGMWTIEQRLWARLYIYNYMI